MSSRGRNGLAWALLAIAGGEGTAHACEVTVPVVDAGEELARVCPDAVEAMGFTLVDLSEQWAPLPFSPAETKPPKFRDTYLALAVGDDPDGGELAPEEKLVEMYGITPAPSVVLARLNQDKRHACHAAIDNTALGTVKKDIKETGGAQAEV